MPKYRKKPVIVDAMLYTGSYDEVRDWVSQWDPAGFLDLISRDGSLHIPTLEGVMKCDIGDHIIRGTAGEFYPCKPEIFPDIYEAIPLCDDDGIDTTEEQVEETGKDEHVEEKETNKDPD